MARPPLLRLTVPGYVRIVVALDLVCADLLGGEQGIGGQHQVFDLDLFGDLETRGVAVVKRPDCVRGDFGTRVPHIHRDQMLGDLPLLCTQLRKPARRYPRCEAGIRQRTAELLYKKVSSQ